MCLRRGGVRFVRVLAHLKRIGSVCGDGILDPEEFCDDGNTRDDDGCPGNCLAPNCGNGQLDAGEACDDGNAVTKHVRTRTGVHGLFVKLRVVTR